MGLIITLTEGGKKFMRFGSLLLLLCVGAVVAQEGDEDKLARRYSIDVNEDIYPQKKPEEALKSVVKAIGAGHIDYLLAHLADPGFVDKKVAEYRGLYKGKETSRTVLAFDRLVSETTKHFRDDPLLVAELKRFANEGEWKTEDKLAAATAKSVPGRQVSMRKVQDRWFLENRR
jgi:hypothetical protein